MALQITSLTNPRLKDIAALGRRRAPAAAGLTVVDGFEELALATSARAQVDTVLYCPDLMPGGALSETGEELLAVLRESGATLIETSRAAFEKVAYREGPDGFLATVHNPACTLAELSLPEDPLILVGEGIEKPGNLGAMLRTADAAGVAVVLAVDPVTDWGNPNVVRASKGTVFSVPVASANREEAIEWLRGHGIRIVATTPDTELTHTDAAYAGGVAIAVGTEKYGLTTELLAAADDRVRIPMFGQADSLNVSTSAAIVLYEAVRQRLA